MVSPPSWQPEENVPDLAEAASLYDFLLNSLDFSTHCAGTIPYSPPVYQVDFDPAGVQDHHSAFPKSNSSFDSDDSGAMLTPINMTQDHITWISSGPEYGIGPALTENPVMSNPLQADNGVFWYSVSSAFDSLQIPCTTSPKLETLSLGEDIGESLLQTTADPLGYTPTVVDVPPTGWAIDQPEADFSPGNPSTFNLVDPPFGIGGSSFPGENVQIVGPENPVYTSVPTLEDLVWPCGWKNEDGTLCDEVVTRASLPMHLAKHGIKNKPRDSLIKCGWLGCKKRKSMNRESIVRHTREVHMRLRRPSKR